MRKFFFAYLLIALLLPSAAVIAAADDNAFLDPIRGKLLELTKKNCDSKGAVLVNQNNKGLDGDDFFSKGLSSDLVQREKVEDISPLLTKVEELVENGRAKPAEIVVVLDLDGTLTMARNPKLMAMEVQEKGNAVETIRKMLAKGVKVVISSAWKNFEETLYRVSKLGLLTDMGVTSIIDDLKIQTFTFSYPIHYENEGLAKEQSPITMYSAGNIVSATSGLYAPYFSAKDLAAYGAPGVDVNETKFVLFADDSEENVSRFANGIQSSNVFGNCEGLFVYDIK